jgi:LysM repeat protein
MGWKSLGAAAALYLVVCSPPVSAQTVHILAEGETLYSLSRRYGVELGDILRTNGIADPSSMAVGTRLVIPDGSATNEPRSMYTVASGDTYYGIARRHGMTVDELLEANGRNSDRILRVGETLVVVPGVGRDDEMSSDNAEIGPQSDVTNSLGTRVSGVPRWPVAGEKRSLDGKLVGVSIQAEPMSYVHAVATGDVVWTGPYRGFGHVVLIDSGGYIYLYGGNEDLFVNVGQSVAAGNRIGRLGSSGPSGGTKEMIFSVFREGLPVSPDDAPRG